jgi:ribonuclease P/MRP protein subunit RPP1
MYFELNLPLPLVNPAPTQPQLSKKQKQKQKQAQGNARTSVAATLSVSEKQAIEDRIELLVHLGYTVIAFNYIVQSKFDPQVHRLPTLDFRKRRGVVFLTRLTIVLDDASEGGFGLTNANGPALAVYDIIALQPTTTTTFSPACLNHTAPSQLTTHIISLDLASQPRLPFYLRLSIVRTAIRNGAVFEINYAPALDSNADLQRRNWWGNAREVARVTNGKNIIFSAGGRPGEVRAPRDVVNLMTMLGINQNFGLDAMVSTPKSLVLRAQTRKTYRAVLSEPVIVYPNATPSSPDSAAMEDAQPSNKPNENDSAESRSPKPGGLKRRPSEGSGSNKKRKK